MASNVQTDSMVTGTDRDEAIAVKNAEACPVVKTLDRVGTTWRLQILYALDGEELRFNELKRATEGRSKTLSDALDVLEEYGLVTRRTELEAPIAVYYTLTEKGEAFLDSLGGIEDWAIEWFDDVEDPAQLRPRV
ncbi:MAG: winged helix-turn-helix transcriptional regulator [Halobacteriales archaeon]